MTAAIVEFPKTSSDVLKQLLATATKLETGEESEACISIQREIICALLRDNQKQETDMTAGSTMLHRIPRRAAKEQAM